MICSTSFYHPDFLAVAWDRVSGNKGARTAGSGPGHPGRHLGDGEVAAFLDEVARAAEGPHVRPAAGAGTHDPQGRVTGKLRRLGIPTAMDRVVQASLELVLEPIFEADFKPVSYGFRPRRRAQDAIAEIHALGSRNYDWVFEADITACFDEIAHSADPGPGAARGSRTSGSWPWSRRS